MRPTHQLGLAAIKPSPYYPIAPNAVRSAICRQLETWITPDSQTSEQALKTPLEKSTGEYHDLRLHLSFMMNDSVSAPIINCEVCQATQWTTQPPQLFLSTLPDLPSWTVKAFRT